MEFSPTLPQLATIVNNISTNLTTAIQDIKRLPELLVKSKRLLSHHKEALARMIGTLNYFDTFFQLNSLIFELIKLNNCLKLIIFIRFLH